MSLLEAKIFSMISIYPSLLGSIAVSASQRPLSDACTMNEGMIWAASAGEDIDRYLWHVKCGDAVQYACSCLDAELC